MNGYCFSIIKAYSEIIKKQIFSLSPLVVQYTMQICFIDGVYHMHSES